MRLLDLFCGAGGAGYGYHLAGWEVVGVDIEPQPDYPFTFHLDDARAFPLDGFDAVHASPPCQRFSKLTKRLGDPETHPDYIGEIRERLAAADVAYIIENVPGSPLIDPVRLCGSCFGLDVQRHRLFESNVPLSAPDCNHEIQTPRFKIPKRTRPNLQKVIPVYGHLNYAGELEVRQRAMRVTWTGADGLAQAIPPAYTEYLGRQLWLAVRASRGLAA